MRNPVVSLIIAVAIIASSVILIHGYNYKFRSHKTISVAGSAYTDFTADLIVWSATFERTSMDIKDAYTKIKEDEQMIRTYLVSQGVNPNEIIFSSISNDKLKEETFNESGRAIGSKFTGYRLTQSVKIESKSIDTIEKVSREITELLQSGMELTSSEPLYYYTKLSDLKIALLAQASADAYNRASTIAKNAHAGLGKLKSADMGVFQITGQHSNEAYTYSGTNNTSSKNKTANIIVRMDYELN